MVIGVSSPKPSAAGEDSDYFMNTEFVVFRVEGVLFRVPTYGLIAESAVFAATFKLPHGNKTDAEGTSANNPIKLAAEIKSHEFKSLLKLLYPLKPLNNLTGSVVNLTREEWMSTLKLATKWHFLNARKVALQALQVSKGTSIEKITLGRELKISTWVLEGYQDLANVDNTTTITDEVAATIGWETTVKLQQLREERLRNKNSLSVAPFSAPFPTPSPVSPVFPLPNTSSPKIFSFSRQKVEKSVEDVFKEELSQIRSEEAKYSNIFVKA